VKEKCDNCGKIDDVRYEFNCLDWVFAYRLKFCGDCGEKIEKILKEGVN
jgi:rRNA maturation protein Nop10